MPHDAEVELHVNTPYCPFLMAWKPVDFWYVWGKCGKFLATLYSNPCCSMLSVQSLNDLHIIGQHDHAVTPLQWLFVGKISSRVVKMFEFCKPMPVYKQRKKCRLNAGQKAFLVRFPLCLMFLVFLRSSASLPICIKTHTSSMHEAYFTVKFPAGTRRTWLSTISAHKGILNSPIFRAMFEAKRAWIMVK